MPTPSAAARTPQLTYIPPVRRALMPTVIETAITPVSSPSTSGQFERQTPEVITAEISKYELKSVIKLMSSKHLRALHYDSWLQFYRDLTAALYGCNAPTDYCQLFSLSAPSDHVPDKLANQRAYYALTGFCAKGEVLAAVQRFEAARDGRSAFLKLHDLCNTTTLLSADVLRYQIQHFTFVETKPPNVQIQRLRELHEQLSLAQ